VTPGKSRLALDIGGHIGYFTLLLANARWSVVTVEPLPSNVILIKASLLANPDIAKNVHLHQLALGTNPGQTCAMMSDEMKSSSGKVMCSRTKNKLQSWVVDSSHKGQALLGYFSTSTLNDFLQNEPLLNQKRIDMMRLDVRGFEDQVVKGGTMLFTKYSPIRIESQIWSGRSSVSGVTTQAFLQPFADAGYSIGHEFQCQSSNKPQEVGISPHQKVSEVALKGLLPSNGQESMLRMCLMAKAIPAVASPVPVAQVEEEHPQPRTGSPMMRDPRPVPHHHFPSPLMHPGKDPTYQNLN